MKKRAITLIAVTGLAASAIVGANFLPLQRQQAEASPAPAATEAAPAVAEPHAGHSHDAEPAGQPPSEADMAAVLAIKPTDIGMGDPNAPVKMIEYASSGCSHCAEMALETIPKVKAAYMDTGKVYYVLRDFPLDNVAVGASLLARCLPKDKFYGFMDVLFAEQKAWHNPEIPDLKEALIAMAAKGGLSRDEAEACLKNEANFAVMRDGQKEAAEILKIDGTPTTFVNGKRLSGAAKFEDVEALITAANAAP